MAELIDGKAQQAEVLALLLAPNSPARDLQDFPELFTRLEELTRQQQELEARVKLLLSVLPTLEEADRAATDAEKQLSQEKVTLADFAGDLGKAAFDALRAGDVGDGPLFADRKALQSQIEDLQQRRLALSMSDSSGMLETAKTKAQILTLTGQLKLEELKVGSANRALGTALLASKNLAPVRCTSTETLLRAIVQQSKRVNASTAKLKEAAANASQCSEEVAKKLSRSGSLTAGVLGTEIAAARKQIGACERQLANLHYELLTKAAASEPLTAKLPALADLEISRDVIPLAGDHIKQLSDHLSQHARKHLSPKLLRYAAAGGFVLILLVLLSTFRSSGPTENAESTEAPTSDAQAGAVGKDGKKSTTPLPKRSLVTTRPVATDASPQVSGQARGIDDLLREMRSLEKEESASRRFIGFTITSKMDKDLYQIVVQAQPPWTERLNTPAVLLTTRTEYTSDGRSSLAVRPKDSRELTLKNGFKKKFDVYEEIAGLDYEEYDAEMGKYDSRLRELGQELTCAFLDKYPTKPSLKVLEIMAGRRSQSPFDRILPEPKTAADALLNLRLRKVGTKVDVFGWEENLTPIEFAVREHDVALFEKLVSQGKNPFPQPDSRKKLEDIAQKSTERTKGSYGDFDKNLNGIMECIRKHAEAAGK